MSNFIMVAISRNGGHATLTQLDDETPVMTKDGNIEVDNEKLFEALDKAKEAVK